MFSFGVFEYASEMKKAEEEIDASEMDADSTQAKGALTGDKEGLLNAADRPSTLCRCSASFLYQHSVSDCPLVSPRATENGKKLIETSPSDTVSHTFISKHQNETNNSAKSPRSVSFFRSRPSWNLSFTAAAKIIRAAAYSLPVNVKSVRLVTDHGVPSWLPSISRHVIIKRMKLPAGEWIALKTDPDELPSLSSPKRNASSLSSLSSSLSSPYEITALEKTYVLYIHGGAFCLCNSATHRGLTSEFTKATKAVLFSVNYRRSPEFPFPTPLQDCLAAYRYLCECVPSESRIFLAGDSAGGNLAIATAIEAHKAGLRAPVGVVLISPWVDLKDMGVSDSWTRNRPFDYLRSDLAALFADAYRGTATFEEVSPSLYTDADLLLLPPLHIEVGECEQLRDQIVSFSTRVSALGISARCMERKDMTHAFPLFAFTGMPACVEAFESIAEFMAPLNEKNESSPDGVASSSVA